MIHFTSKATASHHLRDFRHKSFELIQLGNWNRRIEFKRRVTGDGDYGVIKSKFKMITAPGDPDEPVWA